MIDFLRFSDGLEKKQACGFFLYLDWIETQQMQGIEMEIWMVKYSWFSMRHTVQLIQKMQDQFISAAWLSLLLVKMTNVTSSWPYQLSLINVNFTSKLTEGQNKTWPFPGLHTLSKQLSVLCQRLFTRWCEKEASLWNTSVWPRVDWVFLSSPLKLKASRQLCRGNRVLPVRQSLSFKGWIHPKLNIVSLLPLLRHVKFFSRQNISGASQQTKQRKYIGSLSIGSALKVWRAGWVRISDPRVREWQAWLIDVKRQNIGFLSLHFEVQAFRCAI